MKYWIGNFYWSNLTHAVFWKQAPYLVYVEVVTCDNAHSAPIPCKILESTLRHTRSEEDLTVLRSAEHSPQEEPALDGAGAADFDSTDCWNDEDIAQVVRHASCSMKNEEIYIALCLCWWCGQLWDVAVYCTMKCGAWWLICKFGALRPEGRSFESHSSRHVGTLGKSFTCCSLLRFSVSTPTQYQCCSWERYRNIWNEFQFHHLLKTVLYRLAWVRSASE